MRQQVSTGHLTPFQHQQKHHQQQLQQHQMCASRPRIHVQLATSPCLHRLKQRACQLYDYDIYEALRSCKCPGVINCLKYLANLGAGFGQPAVPATGSSPYSAADIVAGLLNSPVTSSNTLQDAGLPANLNSSNPMPLAPAPAVMLVSHLVIFCQNRH